MKNNYDKETAKNIIEKLEKDGVVAHSIIFDNQSQAEKHVPKIMNIIGSSYENVEYWTDMVTNEVCYRFKKK